MKPPRLALKLAQPASTQTLRRTAVLLCVSAAAWLASCTAPPTATTPEAPTATPSPLPLPPQPDAQTMPPPTLVSHAGTPRDYRRDGARHLYSKNGHRIYKGKLPALVHAVGVLQVDLDGRGEIRQLNWMRAPSHAPDVVREIERTVQAAAPFPAPIKLGGVTYTDVWLWDKSGHFQLDTLTEGQRSK